MTPTVAVSPPVLDGLSFDGGWYAEITEAARHTPWLNAPTEAWSTYGVLLFGVLLAAAWWGARSHGVRPLTAALCAPLTTAAALALSAVIKLVTAEPRPCLAFPHAFLVEVCPGPGDYSFPSNHATLAGAIAVGVLLVDRRLGVLAGIAALAMAASRVYVGIHYPHDVLAGLALGAAVAWAGHLLLRRPISRLIRALTRTRLRPLFTPVPPDPHGAGPLASVPAGTSGAEGDA
ncbi:undecaprenyl-diphosphatase [Streptosporangium subroseum]|uniref:Undecaprenyl-diphosphatase n=1 Tax=Streptosporangium subroseum TaxID=106412 RepID=A0A239LU21_9ACTN|nr:phosphatase PAP2 family protein [Streptosporangium subroseum]SNT33770.1 undecaprenyl-diphosphatase [Streptosporangium subroseum]